MEDDVDGFAHSNLIFHFENGSFCRSQCIGKAIFKEPFSQSYCNREQVLKAFTFFRRHRNKWEGFPEIFDLIVTFQVDAMLGNLTKKFPVSVLKEVDNILSLFLEGFDEGTVTFTDPTMDSIDFVSSNDERCFGLLEDVDGFNGLWLQAFHDINNKNSNDSKSTATIPQ